MTPSTRHVLVAGLLTAGLALTDDAARASVAVKQRTLVVTGTVASDKLTLRARGRSVVVDGARVARRRFDRIRVRAGGGNDAVRAIGRLPVTLDGGRGNDTLLGGSGRDLLIGGKGRDLADGNGGRDRGRLGAGNDRFLWQPGDGSDAVAGGPGADRLAFAGSARGESLRVARSRVTRDLGGAVGGLDGIERIDIAARGGADTLTLDDQRRAITADLGAADGGSDRVIVNGSPGSDSIAATDTTVTGLAATIALTGREPADGLTINALGGNDSVSGAALTTAFTADGGTGADTLAGGPAPDTLVGGDGDDRFAWTRGDNDDAIDGQAGQDVLSFTGSDLAEAFVATADGGRVRLSRADETSGQETLGLGGVERVDLALLGGMDDLTVNDLSGTDLVTVHAALGAGLTSDGVFVNGTDGDDAITATSGPDGITVGLGARTVAITGAGFPQDGLAVNANGGNDSVRASDLAPGVIRFATDGGPGNDELIGGPADESFSGGADADSVAPGPGADRASLGAGDDVYRWQTGDGSDAVDGEQGRDALVARGTADEDSFVLRADGPDAKFDSSTVFLGATLRSVEEVALDPLGGTNRILVQDVSSTSVQSLAVNLGEGDDDTVSVEGSAGDDTLTVGPVLGLPGNRTLAISGARPGDDQLEVEGLAGNDRIDASALPAGTIGLELDGGQGDDVLVGSAGADTLIGRNGADRLDGGDGPDRLFGGDGDDDLLGGPGDDVLRGDDGNDNLFGGPGVDDLDGGPGNDVEVD